MQGFGERHGGLTRWETTPDGPVLHAGDGSTAALDPPYPAPDAQDVAGLVDDALRPRAGRRPPGNAGVATPARCWRVGGSRRRRRAPANVQSRTAAGGWSQQRYARRRANQADDLVGALVEHSVRLVVPASPAWLVTGGDRPLVEAALDDARLRPLAGVPRGRHLTVPDPSGRVVADLPRLLRTFQVRLRETTG